MKRALFSLVMIALLGLLAGLYWFSQPKETTALAMGTTVRIKAEGEGAVAAIAEIKRLEHLFSRFEPQSDVGRLNLAAGETAVEISPETLAVVGLAQEVEQASGGAFDVTLGRPDDLIVDYAAGKALLTKAGDKIDLGGIGKGYAVEAARRLLLKKKVKSAIIDMHSSIAVIGDNWRIGVTNPQTKELLGVVILNDGDALSTSGQYEQPGHIIDPNSGRPADKSLSVTVIARDAGLADALSTAIFVLGPEMGLELAKKYNAKALIVGKNGKLYDNFSFKLR
ncbi:MAG TPA: FAD:protein FMN transferase [Candidatus Sulfotelmatobacter sp.]|nr:FAD:protein FMN transferase [Candidatus Sulfotelmatobacter sp.]